MVAERDEHPRVIGWIGTTAMAMGGSNQSLFLIGALVLAQGSAAIPLLVVGLLMSWAALPGWTELILIKPNRVGGIAASCSEAFRPYSPVLANLAGTCYWWGWVPTCGLTALLSASALHQWYLPAIPVDALAVGIVIVFSAVNFWGLKHVTRLAVIIASGSAGLAFVSALGPTLTGRVDWHQATSFHLQAPFGGGFGKFTSAMAGLYLIGFAAPAFEAAACHVGETINPAKNVPRAMFASAWMATVYFLVLPVVWLGVFGPPALTQDLASSLGPAFAPVLGSFAKAGAVWFMVLNMFHGTLTPVTGVARTLSQLSEDGLLPRAFAKRTRRDVPWVASTVTGGMAILFLLGGDPTWVIAAANFTYLIGIALPSVAVWLLRRNEPDLPRLYRAPRGTIMLGVVAAGGWGLTTVFGFEQFGLPTVLFGLGLAYSGAAAYSFRLRRDRAGAPRVVRRSLHLKLTGAMLAVLTLDGLGYLLAVSHVDKTDLSLVALLQDIFVVVAMLTVTVGLVLPGMTAHAVTEVSNAADRLVRGTLADLTRAMRALAVGDLDAARASVENRHVVVHSADEVGKMARSFNVILDEASRAADSLDGAREALLANRHDLERLVGERTVHAEQNAAVAELARLALASSDIDVVLGHGTRAVERTLRAHHVTVLEHFAFGRTLSRLGTAGTDVVVDLLATDETSAPWHVAVASDRPVELDPSVARTVFPDAEPGGACVWAPVWIGSELCFGVVAQATASTSSFSENDLGFVAAVASVIGTAVQRIRAEHELNRQALHDPLTGLANRVLFSDRLAHALDRLRRNPSTLAVLFVDIDLFKVINDSLGHAAGDRLLVQFSDRLTRSLRPGDSVARFGGDEFVILCEELVDEREAAIVGERINGALAAPFTLDGREHIVSASIGIACASSCDAAPADLLRDADAAMYHAKSTGRARSAVFAVSMRTQAVRRLETELALRRAIANDELRLYYQPIVIPGSGAIEGVEALVRWAHPTNGLIGPGEFIPIAEETGLIVPIGEFVLGEACRQTQLWRSSIPGLEHLTVGVNLSGRQIAQTDLVEVVANTIAASGLPPSHLVLEITESVLMADAEYAIRVLRALKALGVRLSVDDFGTGYSSLSYLRRLPVDALKIDRSFVDGLGVETEDSAIVHAIVTLAGSLGLDTVAEGVETRGQQDALIALGCHRAQGYLFSRPISAEALTARLEAGWSVPTASVAGR